MKTSMKIYGAAALMAGLAMVAGPASALAVYTYGASGIGMDPGPLSGQTIVDNFNNGFGPNETPGAGAQILLGSSGSGAEPAGDTTPYEALGTGQTSTFTFSNVGSVSVYLGSIDTYNYIDVLGANGVVEDQITGAELVSNSYGDQQDGVTNRRVYFTNLPSDFTGLLFGSNGVAFEYDDIAVGARGGVGNLPSGGTFVAVPEPATWLMMIVGFGGVGAMMRRARRKSAMAMV